MGHKVIKDNYRVALYPVKGQFFRKFAKTPEGDHEEALRDCNAVLQQVKRHVDDVEFAGVEWDTTPVCEHCGATWTTSVCSPHNDGCCGKDEDVMIANEFAVTLADIDAKGNDY